jgi:hypothetical protein
MAAESGTGHDTAGVAPELDYCDHGFSEGEHCRACEIQGVCKACSPPDLPVAVPDHAQAIYWVLMAAGNPVYGQSDYDEALNELRALLVGLRQAEERNEELEAVLAWLEPRQQNVLGMIERNGFVFRTPLDKPDNVRTDAEKWEKLAFSLYTEICEIDSHVRAALAVEEEK